MAKIFEIEHEGTIYEIEADDATTLGQATVAFRQNVLGGSPGAPNQFSTDGKRSEFPGRAPGSPDPIAIGGIFDSNVPGPSLAPSADRLGAVPERRPYSPPSRRPADVRSGIAFVDELTNPNPEHVTRPRMENRFFGGPIAGEAQRTIANDAIDQYRIPDYTSIGGEPIAPIAQPAPSPPSIPTDNPLGRAVRAEMAKPDVPFVDRRDRIRWAAPETPDTALAPMTPSSLAHGSAAVLTKAAQGIPAMAGDAMGLAADAADAVAPGAGRITKTKVWSGVSKKWEDVDSLLSDTVEGIESNPQLKASRDAAAAHPDRGFFEKGFGYTSERGWHPTEADPAFLGEFGAEQAPNMALMYVAGVPGGIKAFGKTGKAISTFLGLAVPMSMEAQETREAIKRYELTTGESLDPTAKRAVTLGAGIIGGSMERLGFNSVMGRVASRLSPGALARFQKLVGVAGAKVIESMATESVTEGGQGTTTNLAQSALGIKKIEEAFDGVPESMLLGAVMGLVMSSATSYASGDFDADARARADAAEVERVAGEALREAKAKEAADGARKFASSAVVVNPGDAAPTQPVPPTEPPQAMPGAAGPGPTTPPVSPTTPPAQPVPDESVEPVIPQQTQPPAESSMLPPPAAVVPGIPPEGPAVAPQQPVNPTIPPDPAQGIPQQPMPPTGQETQIPQQPVEPVPAMPVTPPVAPVAPVAPAPEPTVPQAVTNDPHMIPAGTPMMATLPDGSTQQVTVQGMAADNVALVIKADGTPTTVPTAALVNPDGSRLTETPVAPKPTGPKPGSSTATAAERMKSFKVGDIVAISDNVGSGMEIIEFKDLPNSKGVVVPHAVLRTVNGTTITRSSIVKANDAQVQHLTKTLAEREAAKNPPAPPVETPQKAPQIVQEAPPAPATTTTAATPATVEAVPSTAPQTESATEAQIPETPAPATTKPARIQYKVGDLVEFGPVNDPTVGEIKSQDGDYFSIESEDGTVVQKADIKVRPARPVAEIASLRAAKEAAAEATTSPAAPGPAPVVVKKKGKKPKATNRPVRESRLNESAARPRTQIVGGETITLLTENSQGTEGPYTTLTFPDGSTTIIARLDSASTAGLPGWHVIDSSVEFSYIADTQKEAVAILATDKKRRGKGARVTSPSMVAPEGDISSIEENIPGNSPEENIPGNSPEINEKKETTGEKKRKLEVVSPQQKKVSAAPAASAPASSGAAPVAVAKVEPKVEPTVDPDTGVTTNSHGVELLPGIIVSYTKNDGSTDSGEIVGRGKNGGIRLNVMDVDTGAERSIIVDDNAITSKLMDSVPVVNSVFDDDAKPIQPEVVPEKKAKELVPEKKAKPAEASKKSLGKHIVQMLADIKSGKTNENIAKIMANLRGKKGRTLPQNVALRALDGARARTAVLMHPMLTGDPFLANGMAEAVAANDDAKLVAFLEKSAPTLAKIANTVANSTSMQGLESPATKFFQSILNGPFASPKSIVAATYKPTATGVARRGIGGVVNSMALTLNKNLSRAGSGGSIGITTGRGGEIMFASLDDGFMLDIGLGELSELMEAPTLVPGDVERGVYALGEDNASDVRSIVADTAAVLNDYVDAYPTASVRVPGLKNQQTAFVSTDGTVNMADSGLAEYLMDRGADIKFSPSGDVVVATTGTGKARKIIGRFEVNVGPGATFTGFSLPTRAVTAVVREMVGEDTTNDVITAPAMLDKQDGGVYRTIPLPTTSSTTNKEKSNWTPAEAAAYDIFAGKDLSAKVTADDVTKIVEAFQSIYGKIEIQPIYSVAHAELLYNQGMVWEGIVDLAKSPGNGGLFSQADGRVFLFIENLNRDTVSPVRAVINTLVHEAIGHYGIQKFVNNAAAFVDDYWNANKAAILADAKFNDGYSNYWERLPFFDGSTTMDAATYAKLFQPHLDKETIHSEDVRLTNRAIAEDHMLAQMEKILAERVAGRLKTPPKWYQQLIAAIRNFINRALEGTTYADKLGIRTGGGVRFVDVESMLSSNSWRTARKSHMDVLRRVEELMASGSKGLDIDDFVEIHGAGNRSVDPKLFIRAVESNKLSEFARTLLAIPKSRTDIEVSDLWDYLFEKGVDMRTLDESGLLKQLDEGMKNPRATVKSIDHVISFIAKNPNGIHTLLSSHDVGKQRLSASTQKLLADFSERGMFVGKDAATADKSMLQKAKDRVAAGEDERLVRRETGWQKGVDGLWRFEISDKDAKFKDKWAKLPAEMNDKEVMLREILDHPKLFAAYPELANVAVTKTDRDDGFAGWFSGNLNRITITSLGNDQLSTLLHEIQHWVQLREGFAGGGSPSDVLERLPKETLEKVKRDLVAKWAGLVTEGTADVERYELTLRLWAKYQDLVDASREADEEFNSYTGDSAEARDMLSAASSAADKALREALKQGEGNAENAPWKDIEHILQNPLMTRAGIVRKLDSRKAALLARKRRLAGIVAGDIKFIKQSLIENNGLFELYRRIAGEIEARATEKRMGLDEAERAARDVEDDEDVKRGKAIILPERKRHKDGPVQPSGALAENVKTPEFRKWFGDSVVVDENGRPMRMYHGTRNAKFDAFRTEPRQTIASPGSDFGLFGDGSYFTSDPDVASEYVPTTYTIDSPRAKDLFLRAKSLMQKMLSDYDKFNETERTAKEREEFQKSPQRMAQRAEHERLLDEYAAETSIPVDGSGVFPVFLSIQNPMDMDAPVDISAWRTIVQKARELIGNDESLPDVRLSAINLGATNEQAFRDFQRAIAPGVRSGGKENATIYYKRERQIMRDAFVAAGIDGITHVGGGRVDKNDDRRHRVYVAFKPTQVKSATGNVGTYGQRPLTGEEAQRLWDNHVITNPYDTQDLMDGGHIALKRETPMPERRPYKDGPVQPSGALAENVRTPEFRKWFGGSKVVDGEGAPLVVYHGTNRDFGTFKHYPGEKWDSGWFGPGFYLTDTPDFADTYAQQKTENSAMGGNPQIMPLYANIRQPYYATVAEKEAIARAVNPWDRKNGDAAARAFHDKLVAQGYDGVIAEYPADLPGNSYGRTVREIVVFDNKQLKSATGNTGAFGTRPPTSTEAANAGFRDRRLFFEHRTESALEQATNAFNDGDVRFRKADPTPEPPPEVAEQHRRLEETNGIEDDATFTGKVIEHFTDIRQNMTQAFPRLFTTKRPVDAVVNDQLRQLNEATSYASAVTGNVLRDITAGLTKAQEKQMGYILAIRDVVNQIKVDGEKGALESHGALQFGIKSLDHALEVLRFEESMADDAIRGAIAKRQAFMKQFVQQLKEYGLLPENHKDAETYFRRQTLYYYDMSDSAARAWGAKRKLRPASFGGFKQRTGSGMQSINAETNDFRRRVHEFDVRVAAGWSPTPAESLQNARLRKEISNRERDFNTNYRQSEFEHIAAGYHTMRSMDVLKSMRALIDEGPILRMEARELNLIRAYGGAANMTRVNDLLEESRALGKGANAKERARKKEITQELDQIDPLAPARKKMGQGIGMLGHSLKKNGIPHGLPPEHHFIAEELVRKAMTASELEEATESGMFDASPHGYTEMEEGSLFGLMKWLDSNHPGKFGGIGLVYKAISERQHAIKKAVEDSGETYETAATLAEATRSAPITGDEFEAKGHKATHNRAGLVRFSPDDKHLMFHVMTVGDRMLKVMLDKMETDGIDGVDKTAMAAMLKAAKPALAFGPLAEEWYVPENVAKQLNEYGTNKGNEKFNAFHSAVAAWKSWKLQGPISVLKYNINNTFGDADAVYAAYPGAFRLVPQVLKDLREYHGVWKLKKNFAITPGIRDIESRIMSGVASGGLSASELADLDNEIMLANKEWNPRNPLSVTGQAIGKYFATASKYSNARENVLRIAVHRYLENLAKTNDVLPRGASSGAELDMMAEGYRVAADRLDRLGKHNAAKELLEEGKKAQIAKVARELLGDYGNISAAGQMLRRGPIPFVSWLEINAPRYWRLLKNSYYDPTLTPGSRAGKIARIGAAGAAAGAVRVVSTVVKAHFLMAAVSLFNHFFFGDEEKEFGSSRNQMHLMLGHNDDGSLRSLRAQGALSDVYGWVGLETPIDDFRRLRAGEVTKLGLFLYEPVKAVINKVVNGIDPFSKGLFEGLSGSKFYPSVFKDGEGFERDRRYSRDGITEGILNSIVGAPMPDIFRSLNDTPSRKKDVFDYFLTYRTDPREQAFWDTKDIVQGWIEKTGKGNPAGSAAPLSKDTSQALYKYRKAVQYGWPELADHWASEFLKAGGKPMALTTSIRKAGPLDGIPVYNRLEFYKSLNPDQKRSVDIAREWYDEQAKQLESNMKDRPEYPEGLRNEYRERKLLAAQPKYPKGIDKASTFIPGTSGMMKSQYLGNQDKR